MVNQYGGKGLELLIVVGETDSFMNNKPTPQYCQALQDTQKAHVLYDPDGQMTGVLQLQINSGAAIIDEKGQWLTNPVGEESFSQAYGKLFTLFMFGP